MNKIPVSKPFLGKEEAEAASRAIMSGWVTQGPEVQAFEAEFAEFVGSKHACAVSNCTVALQLALLVVGVEPGSEVITVSHSFIATANSIRHCGALPVFVDIEADSLNIDAARIEQAITHKTKAILCVHQVGQPCDLTAILAVASRHNLPVIEDAACAIGSEILWQGRWEKIGRPHGDVACFSFHPRKLLSTGDGGMLTTNRSDFDQRLRLLRQHGMSVSDLARHNASAIVFETYDEVGFNFRMTDIQAAIGREQLRKVPIMVERRRALVAEYRHRLAEFNLPMERSGARSNWQSFWLRVRNGQEQRQLMQALAEVGIATRRGIMCAHREPAYAHGNWRCAEGANCPQCRPGQCTALINSERAQDESVILPLFHELSSSDLVRICNAIEGVLHGLRS